MIKLSYSIVSHLNQNRKLEAMYYVCAQKLCVCVCV